MNHAAEGAPRPVRDRGAERPASPRSSARDRVSENTGRADGFTCRASDDELLVQRIVAGEGEAFELVMRRYNQLLFRAARAVVRNDAEAEDVVQEAYVKAFGALDRFESRSSLGTWLVRIVVNEARTRLRRTARLVPLAAVTHAGREAREGSDDAFADRNVGLSDSSRGPEDAVSDAELRNVLAEAVDHLPDTLRAVFVLRCVQGLSVAETAACLDLSPESVRIRLYRARAWLREDIDRTLTRDARRLFSFGHEHCDRVVARVLERMHREVRAQAPGPWRGSSASSPSKTRGHLDVSARPKE